MQESQEARTEIRTHSDTQRSDRSASWPLLAASFLSQACPSAAPLFHSCAMLVALRKSRPGRNRNPHSGALK